MAEQLTGGHAFGLGTTGRTDTWWLGPIGALFGLGFWVLYYAWAAWQGSYYLAGPYLSPLYAPLVFADPEMVPYGGASPEHAWIGAFPAGWPSWLPASPALLIFAFPASFRASCYYYRKVYYRVAFGSPPGCAVGALPVGYRGEAGLLVFQNLHRYTLYLAILLLPFLFLEAANAFFWEGRLGAGLGGLLLLGNAILLSCYTLGCHAWRHLIGGRLNCFSCDGISVSRYEGWRVSTWLNQRHFRFAWASLYWILVTDLYIRLVSMGIVPDLNTWNGLTWVGDF